MHVKNNLLQQINNLAKFQLQYYFHLFANYIHIAYVYVPIMPFVITFCNQNNRM